jgi:Uma2 family endonuclease
MANPSSSRESAGDPSLNTFAPPRPETDLRDTEHPVLFRGVTWADYDAMLRIRGERRFRITYDRGAMEVIFPYHRERFSGVSWDDYEAMLRIAGDGPLRTTYDRGEMEVIIPSYRHEALTRLFQTLLTDLLRALRVPYKSGGSTTFRRQGLARGLEPDLCYYLRDLDRLRAQPETGPEAIAVPDLAIEVEVSRSALDKLAIYAALGVPEVWRFDGQAVAMHRLRPDGTFEESQASAALPQLPIPTLAVWLRRGLARDEMAWGDQVMDWIRQGMPPLAEDEADGPEQP